MTINLSSIIANPYTTTLNGTTLSNAINGAADTIAITGPVVFNTADLVLNNPNIDIVGTGSLTSSGNRLVLRRFKSIDGLATLRPSYTFVPSDSQAGGGVVKNIADMSNVSFSVPPDSIALTTPANVPGLVFDNIGQYVRFWGAVNGVTISHITSATGVGPIISLNGNNNIIEYCNINANGYTIAAKFQPLNGTPSSWGNIFRHNTFQNAAEETTGWDCLGPATCRLVGRISSINGSTISVTTIHGPVDSAFTSGIGMASPLTGSASVGMTVLVCSGLARDRYFKIASQSGSTLTLDTSKFSLTGAAVDDIITINIAFVENEFYDNTVLLNCPAYSGIGYGQHVGISLWGSCMGNNVHDNTITSTIAPTYNTQSCGINDGGIILLNGGQFSYGLNSRNTYTNNHTNNVYEDLRLTTFYYNDSYYVEDTGYYEGLGKVTETDLGIMSMRISCRGHVANPHNYVSIHNILDVVWAGNDTAVPSTVYDERYQSALSGQPALGGITSTTFAPPESFSVSAVSANVPVTVNIPQVKTTYKILSVSSSIQVTGQLGSLVYRIVLVQPVNCNLQIVSQPNSLLTRIVLLQSVSSNLGFISSAPLLTKLLLVQPTNPASLDFLGVSPVIYMIGIETNPIRAADTSMIRVFYWDGSQLQPVVIHYL